MQFSTPCRAATEVGGAEMVAVMTKTMRTKQRETKRRGVAGVYKMLRIICWIE